MFLVLIIVPVDDVAVAASAEDRRTVRSYTPPQISGSSITFHIGSPSISGSSITFASAMGIRCTNNSSRLKTSSSAGLH